MGDREGTHAKENLTPEHMVMSQLLELRAAELGMRGGWDKSQAGRFVQGDANNAGVVTLYGAFLASAGGTTMNPGW